MGQSHIYKGHVKATLKKSGRLLTVTLTHHCTGSGKLLAWKKMCNLMKRILQIKI